MNTETIELKLPDVRNVKSFVECINYMFSQCFMEGECTAEMLGNRIAVHLKTANKWFKPIMIDAKYSGPGDWGEVWQITSKHKMCKFLWAMTQDEEGSVWWRGKDIPDVCPASVNNGYYSNPNTYSDVLI